MNEKQSQVIQCKCGSNIAACLVPMCYTDKDWMKEIRSYSKQGYTIGGLSNKEYSFERCKCQPKLF